MMICWEMDAGVTWDSKVRDKDKDSKVRDEDEDSKVRDERTSKTVYMICGRTRHTLNGRAARKRWLTVLQQALAREADPSLSTSLFQCLPQAYRNIESSQNREVNDTIQITSRSPVQCDLLDHWEVAPEPDRFSGTLCIPP